MRLGEVRWVGFETQTLLEESRDSGRVPSVSAGSPIINGSQLRAVFIYPSVRRLNTDISLAAAAAADAAAEFNRCLALLAISVYRPDDLL